MNFKIQIILTRLIKCSLMAAFIVNTCFSNASAQGYRYSKELTEIGIKFGPSLYQGDITEKPLEIRFLRPSGGLFVRTYFSHHFSFRFGLNYGTITAFDSISKVKVRQIRNLSFVTTIYDASTLLEYCPFTIRFSRFSNLKPYLFTGLSFFYFNPRAQYQGEWYDLVKLSTEGQGISTYPHRAPYKRTQIGIPMGGGMRYKLNPYWSLGFDIKAVRTYTDYLDDISSTYVNNDDILRERGPIAAALADRGPEKGFEKRKDGFIRGKDTNKDYYFLTGITITYTPLKKSPCLGF